MCSVTQLCTAVCDLMENKPNRLLWPWGFSSQEYFSGMPCPSPGDIPTKEHKLDFMKLFFSIYRDKSTVFHF